MGKGKPVRQRAAVGREGLQVPRWRGGFQPRLRADDGRRGAYDAEADPAEHERAGRSAVCCL